MRRIDSLGTVCDSSGKAIADLMSALEGKLSRDPDVRILEPHPAGDARKGAL